MLPVQRFTQDAPIVRRSVGLARRLGSDTVAPLDSLDFYHVRRRYAGLLRRSWRPNGTWTSGDDAPCESDRVSVGWPCRCAEPGRV